MGIEVIIWDFDGTFTVVDQEAVPYLAAFKNDLMKALKLKQNNMDLFWSRKEKLVRENPTKHGWKINNRIVAQAYADPFEDNGKIIAPAYADPFVECRTIADLLLREHTEYWDDLPRVDNSKKRDAFLQRLYDEHYPKCPTVFKQDAAAALVASKEIAATYVVTNSNTNTVQQKIGMLGHAVSSIPIVGGAKKYVLDDDWTELPESVQYDGFERPLYLRRRQYAEILSRIMQEKNVSPENVLVAGDIYELDLLVPQQLGMHIALLPRDRTPAYERNAVTSYSKGVVCATLLEVVQYAQQRS